MLCSSFTFAVAWSSLSERAAANELSNMASCCPSSISLAACCWICDSASDSLACEDSLRLWGNPAVDCWQKNKDPINTYGIGWAFEPLKQLTKSSKYPTHCWIATPDVLVKRTRSELLRALTLSPLSDPLIGLLMTLEVKVVLGNRNCVEKNAPLGLARWNSKAWYC